MLSNTPVIAFLATADAAKARAFYEGVIGLTLLDESDFALVFDANGVELRIQKVESANPQPFTVLGWHVSSIVETVEGMTERGVVFEKFAAFEQSELGIWTSPSGAQIAWFRDPDGNTLSLTET